MRIHQVCADRGVAPGGTKGAARHLASVAGALARAGHQVTTYARRRRDGADHPVEVRPLADLASAARPDAVYERYSLGHDAGLEQARGWGVPFVLEVNAPLVAESLAHRPDTVGPGDAATERRLLAAADLVVCVSEPLRAWAATRRGTARGTIVLPNGVDPERFAVSASPAEAAPVIGFLGHPKPWHGVDRLTGLLGAARRSGFDARLLVIGGGPGADAVAEAATADGLVDHVEVTGPVDPTTAATRLREVAVAVAPYHPHSDFYFCPIKIVEYLAAGLPIVTTDQGDIPALVGDAAVVCPAADDRAIESAVVDLLGDRAARGALGAAARSRGLHRFSWDALAERLLVALANPAAAA